RSYSAHWSLLSFPTRRSSDLHGKHYLRSGARVAGDVSGKLRDIGHDQRARLGCGGSAHSPAEGDLKAAECALVRADAQEAAGLQDRKSTRLNSSHVKISYAVF